MSVDLSVIIVNWNVREMLRECLKSLEQYHGALSLEIIVVDSASSDASAEMVAAEFPDVKLLAQSENVGFVGGNNLGLASAQGRYLLLLNPDTRVHHHALAKMIAYMEDHPQVGILGPHTLNGDGTHQSTRRRFPTLFTAAFESTWLQALVPKILLERFYMRDAADDSIVQVDWVQGSALLARREVYEQIGGLDPAYVMFFEEVDWCKRAKLAGWEAIYLGEAHITHYGGGSTAQADTRKHLHFQQSKLYYFKKFHGVGAALVLRLILIMNYGVQVILEGAKLFLGHRPDLRRARIQTYAAVLRALLGRPQTSNPITQP